MDVSILIHQNVKRCGASTRAGMGADALLRLGHQAITLYQNFGSLADRLKNFSPEIAIQNAYNNINRVNQNFDHARRLGKPLAEFEKQRGRMEIALGEITANHAESMAPIFNRIAAIGADILEMLADWTKWSKDKFLSALQMLDDTFVLFVENVPFMKSIFGDIKKIREIAQKKAAEDERNVGVNGINDFFGMQLPGANAQPKLNGPNMAMPIFRLNPANP